MVKYTDAVFFFKTHRCEPYRLNFTALPYANPSDRWLIACVVPPASVSGTNTSGSISPIGGSNARMKDNPAIVADLVEGESLFIFHMCNSTDVVFCSQPSTLVEGRARGWRLSGWSWPVRTSEGRRRRAGSIPGSTQTCFTTSITTKS